METIRLGILGTSEIAPRSIIQPSLSIKGVQVYGIASRELSKAEVFAKKHSIPNFFGSYQALLNNKDIDAVYIPLINSLHAEWTIRAIEAGKHVLVEKPICFSENEANEIQRAIDRYPNIIVMEGLMSEHHPWNDEIENIVKTKKYGKLKSIKTRACYNLDDENDFRLFPEKGGSVFFEEGLLWCHLTQICLGLKPVDFTTECEFNGPNGGDHTFQVRMSYPNNVSSELFCSYDHPYQADHFLEFEKADIKIRNFWRPTFGKQKMKFEIKWKHDNEIEYFRLASQDYYSNQLSCFFNKINNKKEYIYLNNSFERIAMMEKIYNKTKDFNPISNLSNH